PAVDSPATGSWRIGSTGGGSRRRGGPSRSRDYAPAARQQEEAVTRLATKAALRIRLALCLRLTPAVLLRLQRSSSHTSSAPAHPSIETFVSRTPWGSGVANDPAGQ